MNLRFGSLDFHFINYIISGRFVWNLVQTIGAKMADNNFNDKDFEDILRDDVNQEMNQQLHKCFKKYGIEGTEEKIKELYALSPKIKELFLIEYRKILKGKK